MSGNCAETDTMERLFDKAADELIESPFETAGNVADWLEGDELRFGPDEDGDVLIVEPERDADGLRYVGVLRPVAGDEGKSYLQGVLLTADQQLGVATALLGYDPTQPPDRVRADAARTAADILRSRSMFGSGGGDAAQVIALATWIADGDPEVALLLDGLKYEVDEL